MTKNFIHYLRCLCADEFNRAWREKACTTGVMMKGDLLAVPSTYLAHWLNRCKHQETMMRLR